MGLYWITYQIDGLTAIVFERGDSLVQARMKLALAGLQAGYIDGYELDDKRAAKLPMEVIGRPLSRSEATKLLTQLQ